MTCQTFYSYEETKHSKQSPGTEKANQKSASPLDEDEMMVRVLSAARGRILLLLLVLLVVFLSAERRPIDAVVLGCGEPDEGVGCLVALLFLTLPPLDENARYSVAKRAGGVTGTASRAAAPDVIAVDPSALTAV